MVYAFNPSTRETEAGGSLRVQDQLGLQSEFQNSQGTEKPCLKKTSTYMLIVCMCLCESRHTYGNLGGCQFWGVSSCFLPCRSRVSCFCCYTAYFILACEFLCNSPVSPTSSVGVLGLQMYITAYGLKDDFKTLGCRD